MAKKESYDITADELARYKALYRAGDLGCIIQTMPAKWRVSAQTMAVFMRTGETRSPRLATYVRRFYDKKEKKRTEKLK